MPAPWPLRFGVFYAPFHPVGQNPTLALEYDLERVVALDAMGYDEAWFGEHHSGGYEIIACPEIFIAAAAERTKHIRLGTGVVSLPYHHPWLVADRLVLLDHLTRGRMIFGAGPGYSSAWPRRPTSLWTAAIPVVPQRSAPRVRSCRSGMRISSRCRSPTSVSTVRGHPGVPPTRCSMRCRRRCPGQGPRPAARCCRRTASRRPPPRCRPPGRRWSRTTTGCVTVQAITSTSPALKPSCSRSIRLSARRDRPPSARNGPMSCGAAGREISRSTRYSRAGTVSSGSARCRHGNGGECGRGSMNRSSFRIRSSTRSPRATARHGRSTR